MKLSIIIPSKGNRPDFLKEAIQSAEECQANCEKEIIVIEKDQTLGKNVNTGFLTASGNWIKILADDDLMPTTFDLDWPESESFLIALGKVIIKKDFMAPTWPSWYQNRYMPFSNFVEKNHINGAGIIYHQSIMEKNSWSESLPFAEEREFHLRAFEHLNESDFYCSSSIYGIYRIHKDNKSRNADPDYRKKVLDEINRPWRQKYL